MVTQVNTVFASSHNHIKCTTKVYKNQQSVPAEIEWRSCKHKIKKDSTSIQTDRRGRDTETQRHRMDQSHIHVW